MRRRHHTLICLSLLATAACTADSVAGPQAVPAPKVQAKAARPVDPPGAPQRGPKQVWITRLEREPLFVVDGVMQREDPRHLTGAEIAHIQVLRGEAATAAYGEQGTHGVVIITTRAGRSSAP